MRKEQLGGLQIRIGGGTDGRGGGEGPLVVLLHGFGAPGDDLVALAGAMRMPAETRFVFPEAPFALGGMYGEGRAWWHIDMMRLQLAMMTGQVRDMRHEIPDGLAAARALLDAMLDALPSRFAVRTEQLVLGGFSQGAMLACDATLRSQRRIAGLALLSGTLIAEKEWAPCMASHAGLPVFQSHGQSDEILPFTLAEALRDQLSGAGLPVTWTPFRGGHGIPPEVLSRFGQWITEVVGTAR